MNTTIKHTDRRDFIKKSGIFLSGMMLLPSVLTGNPFATAIRKSLLTPQGSYLSPFILINRLQTLAIGSSFIGSDIQYALTKDLNHLAPGNAFHHGLSIPFDVNDQIDSLVKLRGNVNPGSLSDSQGQRLALLLGGISGSVIKNELQKAYSANKSSEAETKILHDLALINIYISRGNSFTGKSDDVYQLFKEITPRTFTRFHTIKPDEAMGPLWVLKMQEWRNQNDDFNENIAKNLSGSTAQEIMEKATATGFIKENESILLKVSSFNDIDEISAKDAENLIESGVSTAGKAIGGAYQQIININDFWSGNMTKEELKSLVNK
ncbi:hypothetical protein [Marinigracilibium pacificum]|uniref:Uncharacterized protein n=1 Tax=Marinigracilibium pacificum TaxID=2729599 RepID=A0A848IV42_9BACT|nr:hypothetical protein [Marinigracilibium pacificum]NMM47556.1 hypothetical protein [Marinigracilibium pacificum]